MNGSLNNQKDRRQVAQDFVLKINDLDYVDPDEFNKLLGQACTVGILIKIQEDKRTGRIPEQIYHDIVRQFGKNAYVIKNLSTNGAAAYYLLHKRFRISHLNLGKAVLEKFKKLQIEIVRKQTNREKRDEFLKEIHQIYDAMWVKYEAGEMTENDFLQMLNFLEKHGVIRVIPGETDTFDFYWKYFAPQPEGRPVLKTKKYVYSGPRDKGSIEYAFFMDVKRQFRIEIIKQIRQKQGRRNLNAQQASSHVVDCGGSRKMDRLMLHELKGDHATNKRERKIARKREKERTKQRECNKRLQEKWAQDDE